MKALLTAIAFATSASASVIPAHLMNGNNVNLTENIIQENNGLFHDQHNLRLF